MIIACLDDLGQEDFIKNNPEKAVYISDSLDLDSYIAKIKEEQQNILKQKLIFVSPDKRQALRDNNIRYFAAYKMGKEVEETNHIRLQKDETIEDRFGSR